MKWRVLQANNWQKQQGLIYYTHSTPHNKASEPCTFDTTSQMIAAYSGNHGLDQPRYIIPTGKCLAPQCLLTVLYIWQKKTYRQISITKGTLEGNKIIDHSDVTGASPVGAARTTSSF